MRERDTERPALRIRNSSRANSRGLKSTTRPPRQHHVEHDAAVRPAQRTLQCAVAGVGLGDAVAFFAERFAQEAPQLAVIFDEENLHAAKPTVGRGSWGV